MNMMNDKGFKLFMLMIILLNLVVIDFVYGDDKFLKFVLIM